MHVITDESYAASYFTTERYWGLSLGYLNQEICKLAFWETGCCENYLCVDSDAYFVRNFYKKDFIREDGVPYSVLVMDKDLNIERHYQEFGAWRQEMIKKIFDYVGYADDRMLTCHGMTVMNRSVLENMKDVFLSAKGVAYRDLISIAPYEYTWYNVWLQKAGIIPVLGVEPFFKTFHARIEYVFSKSRMLRESDIALRYVGIVLNSNWEPKSPPRQYGPILLWQRMLYRFLRLQ
ncbi:MAG: hypothetical protein HGA33_00310 [Candidatus Moranbacteria bacterium]|nr:hypothetical protein [Candidatus Moranbacteria bacterium]